VRFKRYMVFEFGGYDAAGGLDDCYSHFDDPGPAVEAAQAARSEFVYVFDRTEGITLPFVGTGGRD
jgi:hypothetical protein